MLMRQKGLNFFFLHDYFIFTYQSMFFRKLQNADSKFNIICCLLFSGSVIHVATLVGGDREQPPLRDKNHHKTVVFN